MPPLARYAAVCPLHRCLPIMLLCARCAAVCPLRRCVPFTPTCLPPTTLGYGATTLGLCAAEVRVAVLPPRPRSSPPQLMVPFSINIYKFNVLVHYSDAIYIYYSVYMLCLVQQWQ